jgi:hypothetical protein
MIKHYENEELKSIEYDITTDYEAVKKHYRQYNIDTLINERYETYEYLKVSATDKDIQKLDDILTLAGMSETALKSKQIKHNGFIERIITS